MHAADFDRAYVLARGIARRPRSRPRPRLGLARVAVLGPALPLPGILGLPLRWVADGPLASTLLQVLAAHSAGRRGHRAPAARRPVPGVRASRSPSRAGIDEAARLRAALGRPLTDALRAA